MNVWGGIECSVTRIRDTLYDQIAKTGHVSRVPDIDLFADIGITRLRYPIIWERIEPDATRPPAWHTVDAHLDRMRERNIVPIAGLLHHGTGPSHGSLVHDDFPIRFAQFAARVAKRYSWIDDWTPINEPVTTARFCGLYGHWFPHAQDDRMFVRLLLRQCEGIIRAMLAIRRINPSARYVHTEDVGRILSTESLAYQARFENLRQRSALDIIAGRMTEAHALWPYLHSNGMTRQHREWFEQRALSPDIIAADYYRTSDRYLDDRVDAYDASFHGGNGVHRYADVAGSAINGWRPSLSATLVELSDCYQTQVAVGEVHCSGSMHEQLTWAAEMWQAAQEAESRGARVAGVTFWALLGSFDWASLMCESRGHYESGAFDISTGLPRATALAAFIRTLAPPIETADVRVAQSPSAVDASLSSLSHAWSFVDRSAACEECFEAGSNV